MHILEDFHILSLKIIIYAVIFFKKIKIIGLNLSYEQSEQAIQ